jgi:hypothetical protein
LRTDTKTIRVEKRLGFVFKVANNYRFNNQTALPMVMVVVRDLYDQLMSTRVFTLSINEMFV